MESDSAAGGTGPIDGKENRTSPNRARIAFVFLALAAALGTAIALDLDQYLTLQTLADNRAWLLDQVDRNAVVAVIAFIAIYAVSVAVSVPGATVLTVTGGFLFGTALGSAYAVIGATLGAIGVFMFVRAGLGDSLKTRAGSSIDRLRRGFHENALGYLLFLRLLPVFPFFIVNLAAAILGVPLRAFALATLVGIVPGSLVYASIGNGLGFIIDGEAEIDLGVIFTPEVFLPLVGLAVLSLAPVLYKAVKRRRMGKVS